MYHRDGHSMCLFTWEAAESLGNGDHCIIASHGTDSTELPSKMAQPNMK